MSLHSYFTIFDLYFTISKKVLKVWCSTDGTSVLPTINWTFLNASISPFLKIRQYIKFINRGSCGTRLCFQEKTGNSHCSKIWHLPPLIPKLSEQPTDMGTTILQNSLNKGHFGFSHQDKPYFFIKTPEIRNADCHNSLEQGQELGRASVN